MPVVIMLHMMMQPVMCLGETSRARPPAAQALTRLAATDMPQIPRSPLIRGNEFTNFEGFPFKLDISWPHYVHIIETPWDGSGSFHFLPISQHQPQPQPSRRPSRSNQGDCTKSTSRRRQAGSSSCELFRSELDLSSGGREKKKKRGEGPGGGGTTAFKRSRKHGMALKKLVGKPRNKEMICQPMSTAWEESPMVMPGRREYGSKPQNRVFFSWERS